MESSSTVKTDAMFVTLMKFCKNPSRKTVLVTGSNEGLGYQTALALARQNCRVILADKNDLTLTKDRIMRSTSNENVVTKHIDFASLASVRSFAEEIKGEDRLDVLINNVGVFCLGKDRTEDGLVGAMQVNHFGPFLLTHLLSEILVKSAPSRILFVSSLGAFFSNLTVDNINDPEVSCWDALSSLLVYYNSKLCNIITANGFARRLAKYGVSCNSLHPGMTATAFLSKNPLTGVFLKSPEMGAQQAVYLASSRHVGRASGKFFVDFKEHQQPNMAADRHFCDAIWSESECFVELQKNERISLGIKGGTV